MTHVNHLCTDCGEPGATIKNRDADDVQHYWHEECWREFKAWLSRPLGRMK
jgi:hypothetical protein